MSDPKVNVEILSCKNCGTLAVSIGDYRITAHKCSGAWNVLRTEGVPISRIMEPLEAAKAEVLHG